MIAIILTTLVITGLAGEALWLRVRVPSAIHAANSASDKSAAGPNSVERNPADEWAWLTVRGAVLDDATRSAAIDYAGAEGLDLLDLVPADLPATPARDMLRAVDPRAYRADRLARGRSAGTAVCATRTAWERAVAEPSGKMYPALDTREGLEPADLIMSVRRIRPCARPHGAAIAVAPTLRAVSDDLAKRAARLRANGVIVLLHQAADAFAWLLTAGALLAGWQWGLGALAAYCLQPYLIFVGTPLRPRGLHAAALLRPLHDPWTWARTSAGRWRSAAEHARDEEKATSVRYYREALADGTVRFAADRATDCPWCGSDALSVAVRSRDLSYGKPGRFMLERCGDCGHVFQNPRLRPDGLAFYYRDVYDGLGTDNAEVIFLHQRDSYLGRIRMVAPFLKPKAWLDVGAGHAHFCAMAGEAWPDTVFDGIDQGAGITEAERRGWITTGYRGEFRDLASQFAGRYDVVSMHHYLEHTDDPRAELDAAARMLPPGGYLLIELPDPQWPLAQVLGQYWMSWFQPQHLNMMPVANLIAALDERGLRPTVVERGRAHQGFDLVAAVVLLLGRIAPDRSMPWSPRPATTLSRTWRNFAWVAGSPLLAIGLLLDSTLVRALARRRDCGNAYRVLSVKDGI